MRTFLKIICIPFFIPWFILLPIWWIWSICEAVITKVYFEYKPKRIEEEPEDENTL